MATRNNNNAKPKRLVRPRPPITDLDLIPRLPVVLEGAALKRGRLFRAWKDCYIVLKSEVLLFYRYMNAERTQLESQPSRILLLRGYTAKLRPDVVSKYGTVFSLTDNSGEQRNYFICIPFLPRHPVGIDLLATASSGKPATKAQPPRSYSVVRNANALSSTPQTRQSSATVSYPSGQRPPNSSSSTVMALATPPRQSRSPSFAKDPIDRNTTSTSPLPFAEEPSHSVPAVAEASGLAGEWVRKINTFSVRLNILDLKKVKKLGFGAYGVVYLVRKHSDSRVYALKQVPKSIADRPQIDAFGNPVNPKFDKEAEQEDRAERDRRHLLHLMEERSNLERIRHPFLLTLNFAFQDKKYFYIGTEFLEGGELFNLARTQPRRRFSEDVVRVWAAELVAGIEYMHSHHVVHRDIKPENVLLDDEGHVRLADFGFCKNLRNRNGETGRTHTFCGTKYYLPPEMLRGDISHTTAVDWWALGVLLYELMVGRPPFVHRIRSQLYEKIIFSEVSFPNSRRDKARDAAETPSGRVSEDGNPPAAADPHVGFGNMFGTPISGQRAGWGDSTPGRTGFNYDSPANAGARPAVPPIPTSTSSQSVGSTASGSPPRVVTFSNNPVLSEAEGFRLSKPARSLIRGLLQKYPYRRLGVPNREVPQDELSDSDDDDTTPRSQPSNAKNAKNKLLHQSSARLLHGSSAITADGLPTGNKKPGDMGEDMKVGDISSPIWTEIRSHPFFAGISWTDIEAKRVPSLFVPRKAKEPAPLDGDHSNRNSVSGNKASALDNERTPSASFDEQRTLYEASQKEEPSISESMKRREQAATTGATGHAIYLHGFSFMAEDIYNSHMAGRVNANDLSRSRAPSNALPPSSPFGSANAIAQAPASARDARPFVDTIDTRLHTHHHSKSRPNSPPSVPIPSSAPAIPPLPSAPLQFSASPPPPPLPPTLPSLPGAPPPLPTVTSRPPPVPPPPPMPFGSSQGSSGNLFSTPVPPPRAGAFTTPPSVAARTLGIQANQQLHAPVSPPIPPNLSFEADSPSESQLSRRPYSSCHSSGSSSDDDDDILSGKQQHLHQ